MRIKKLDIIKDFSFLYILTILLFTLSPLLWYRPGYLMAGADLHYPFNAENELLSRTFVWSSSLLIGTDRSMDMTIIPFTLIMYFLSFLPISLGLQQIIFIMILYFLIAISIFFLAKRLFKNNNIALILFLWVLSAIDILVIKLNFCLHFLQVVKSQR